MTDEREARHGGFRGRDLLRTPSLVSLSRVALAALFPLIAHRPVWALSVIAAAAASDVADGWWARRTGQVTETGAVVDGVTDKIFAVSVGATLVVRGLLTPLSLLALGAREVGEAPLVLYFLLSPHARRARAERPEANVLGKAVTVLQFVTIAATLLRLPGLFALLACTAVAGAFAALVYARKYLRTG